MVYADTFVFPSPDGKPLKRIMPNQYLSIIDIRMLGRAWYFQSVLLERAAVEDEFSRVISALPASARSASSEGTIDFLNQSWRTTLNIDEVCSNSLDSLMLEKASASTDSRNLARHP